MFLYTITKRRNAVIILYMSVMFPSLSDCGCCRIIDMFMWKYHSLYTMKLDCVCGCVCGVCVACAWTLWFFYHLYVCCWFFVVIFTLICFQTTNARSDGCKNLPIWESANTHTYTPVVYMYVNAQVCSSPTYRITDRTDSYRPQKFCTPHNQCWKCQFWSNCSALWSFTL